MSGNKGFTLIEVVIAVTIIAIAFGVLLDLLYKAKEDIEISEKIFTDTVELDSKVKLENFEGLNLMVREVPGYPEITEKQYTFGEAVIYRYEIK